MAYRLGFQAALHSTAVHGYAIQTSFGRRLNPNHVNPGIHHWLGYGSDLELAARPGLKAMDATVDNFRVALPANRNATHPEQIFLPHAIGEQSCQ
jgi:hypothetical protein